MFISQGVLSSRGLGFQPSAFLQGSSQKVGTVLHSTKETWNLKRAPKSMTKVYREPLLRFHVGSPECAENSWWPLRRDDAQSTREV